MSADVVGSTAFKGRHSADAGTWLEAFSTLFKELPLVFIGEMGMAFLDEEDMPEAGVWKVMGDEVIFVTMPRSAREAMLATTAFVRTVNDYDQRLAARWPLHIRGTCWAAEIGQRNRRIDIPEMFGGRNGEPYLDFLGPDVDTGFRLGAHGAPGEVIISPNLAETIAAVQADDPRLRFHRIGDKPLKGVIAGQPFPLILTSTVDAAARSHPRPVIADAELVDFLGRLREQLRIEHAAELAPPLCFQP
jgi:class 3 adenylate cyclase